jgi:nitroreductase
MLKELITKNRTCRRFYQDVSISQDTLRDLVDLARLSASGNNVQPLKYILSWEPEKNATIFPHVGWAGRLSDWDGPAEGERPAAYIIILLDKEIAESAGVDHGIAAQSIMLGATERGFGGCMMGSVKRKPLREALDIPERYDILLVREDGDPAYWRDEDGVHHVPKRALDDIIVG